MKEELDNTDLYFITDSKLTRRTVLDDVESGPNRHKFGGVPDGIRELFDFAVVFDSNPISAADGLFLNDLCSLLSQGFLDPCDVLLRRFTFSDKESESDFPFVGLSIKSPADRIGATVYGRVQHFS